MSILRTGLAAGLVFATSASLVRGEELLLRVFSGNWERIETPVSTRLDRKWTKELTASLTSDRTHVPAQVVRSTDGKAEVWWIVDRMAAGSNREYTLSITEAAVALPPTAYRWKSSSGDHGESMDLTREGRGILRYHHTPFDAADIESTKKPFHQVFSPSGDGFVTKGVGGLYPHHRGIYFGYNKCTVDGKTYDTWHAAKGEHQLHVEVAETIEGPVVGGHAVRIHWNDRQGAPFATELRRVLVFDQGDGRRLIELSSTLEATGDPVQLDGDPQHAGVQFRAAQFVAEHQKATRYLRPEKWKDLPEDKEVNWPQSRDHIDMPWNAIRFRIDDEPYTVAYLSDPKNPDDARASERLYGRFGEFFPWKLTRATPLEVRYRWWIVPSHEVTREDIEVRYRALAEPPKVEVVR